MGIREFMDEERERIEREILDLMRRERDEAPPDRAVQDIIEALTEFTMRDAKRVRAVLMVLGYKACGGEDLARIRSASVAMELVQSMLLIHDDLMDSSDMRRGGPAFHRLFQGDGEEGGDTGLGMAIIGGDLAESLAEIALASSGFPEDRIVRAMICMSRMVRDTGYGQIMDLSRGDPLDASASSIAAIQHYKTARYTFEGPLVIGALLAGASDTALEALKGYGVPVGISFQVTDDLLGFFGDPKKGGQNDISDLREGKSTLILKDLLDACPPEERERFDSWIGSPSLSQDQARTIRDMARQRKVDQLSRDHARSKVEEGIMSLERADLDEEAVVLLKELAYSLLKRV
ncbi:MAG: polyprenyl synthetase family protein [Candidatus Thermoplasmatota archaeon]|nr:polyprenyl synthetase family protein [Candidatus Thermoplasmatota archaeon]